MDALLSLGAVGAVALAYLAIDDPPKRVTQATRRKIHRRDGGRCVYCRKPVAKFHADHRQSRKNGGSSEPHNLATACPRCNLRKGSLNAAQFRRKLARESRKGTARRRTKRQE